MYRKTCYTLIILALVWTSLFATRSPAAQARPAAPADLAAQATVDCRLLYDPEARALMPQDMEMLLLRECLRLSLDRETYEPGPTPSAEGSILGTIPLFGPDTRVNAVDPPGGSSIQSETSIAVNENTGTLCVTFNDSYHISPDNSYTGFSRSTDGGATWQDGGPIPPGGGVISRGDPSGVWRRVDGYFYYASLHVVGPNYGVSLWRSLDDCATFEWISIAHNGTDDDKEFLAVDNNPSSPYYGRLYLIWSDLTNYVVRGVYSDDGINWQGPVDLFAGVSFGAWPVVASNGDIYVTWMTWDPYPSYIDNQVARSTDGGATFTLVSNPLTDAVAPREADDTAACGRPALNGYIRYFALPQIAVGLDGCLHVIYSYDDDGYGVGDVVNVYYRRSCDNGASWEPEVQLNDDGGLTDQFFPALTVNQDNVVAASWYDRRLDPGGNWYFDRYWTVSYDGGSTWTPNERVSDVSSPVYSSPGATGCYHGDYDQMAYQGDSIFFVWSDDRIWFNGHWDPDIWFDQTMIVPDFTLGMTPQEHDVCLGEVVSSTVTVGSVKGYNQPVTLSDSGLPAGVQTAFTVNPVDPLPGTSSYVITVTDSAAVGTHTWPVSGSSPTLTHDLTVTLVIGDCCEPVHGAAFGWVPLTPTAGQVVTFTASASGTEPISYSWQLGAGKLGIGASVTNVYTVAGEYGVTLTATNDCGEEVVAHTVTVIPTCEPVTATAFTWVPLTPTTGQVVTFTASASGTEPITYSWQLGAGKLGIGASVTNVYTVAGEYAVTLTATNDCGEEVVAHTVTVIPTCEPVHSAAFGWVPLTPTTGQVVTFTASASGTEPITYSWHFDFSNFEFTNPITHVFAMAGEYTVTLTATNGCGVEVVQNQIAVVGVPPEEWQLYLPVVVKTYSMGFR